jgi:chemotaxis protein MotB
MSDRTRLSAPALGLLAVLIVGLTVGCVSKGKYDALAKEKAALEAEKQATEAANTELEAGLDAAESEKAGLEETVATLDAELQDQQIDLDSTVRTYSQLLAELSVEVEAGKIVIEQMASGVNVRIAEDVLFSSGSAKLDDGGVDVIERLGAQLRETRYQVVVAGYTDSVPIGGRLAKTYPTNWDLAAARAARVLSVLERAGINQEHLVAVSFGPTNPVASNDTPEGRAQNRRIEVRIRPLMIDDPSPAIATSGSSE